MPPSSLYAEAPEDPEGRPAPRYAEIEAALATAIAAGRLAEGAILTEGPIAALFGTSRTPVRTALLNLERGGHVARFDGRGFVVAGAGRAAPHRLRLTRSMLGLPSEGRAEPPPVSAERLARSFERSLALALPFGQYRINEQMAADHFDVSRNVIRELMSRLQERGLVRKDLRSHWIVGPLTARDVAHFFAIRGKLEPLALIDSAPRTPPAQIAQMRADLDAALRGHGGLDAERIEALEADLHEALLARSPNTHLLRMIRQSQIALVVNRVFAAYVGPGPFEIALREHAIVLDFVMRGAHGAAAQCLEEHMRLSAERTRQRLMAISVFPEPDLPAYLHKQSP